MHRVLNLGVFLILAATQASALDLCPYWITQSAISPGELRKEYRLRSESLGSDGKRYWESLVLYEYDDGQGLVTRRWQREVKDFPPSFETPSLGRDGHLEIVMPISEFAAEAMATERPQWVEAAEALGIDFRQAKAETTRLTVNDAIYVEVLEKDSGNRLGSVRFIVRPYGLEDGKVVPSGATVRALYGANSFASFRPYTKEYQDSDGLPAPPDLLPLESILGIRLPSRTELFQHWVGGPPEEVGIDMEVGAYAIKKGISHSLRRRVQVELWIQNLMVHLEFEKNQSTAYEAIYADELSQKLYSPMEYEFLRQYQKDSLELNFPQGAKPPEITAMGVDWRPMERFPGATEKFLYDLLTGKDGFENEARLHLKNRVIHLGLARFFDADTQFEHLLSAEDGDPISVHFLNLVERFALISYRGRLSGSSKPEHRHRAELLAPVSQHYFKTFRENLVKFAANRDRYPTYVRERIARLSDLPVGPKETEISRRDLIRFALVPSFLDLDSNVHFWAAYSLRFHFTARELLDVLSAERESLGTVESLTEELTKELGPEALRNTVETLAKFIALARIEAHDHYPPIWFDTVSETVLQLSPTPEQLEKLLYLGAHRSLEIPHPTGPGPGSGY